MINWAKIPDFQPHEFPEDPNKHADPQLMYSLQDYRYLLGRAFFPSPVPGALARDDKSSEHFSNDKFKSRAIDGFPKGCPADAWQIALSSQLWGGIGLYLDTHYQGKKWVMLHLDLRPLGHNHANNTVLLWIRDKNGKYVYPQYEKRGMKYLFKTLKKIAEV